SIQRFFQSNHDVGLDVGAALRSRLTSAKSAESRTAAAATEKRFEEVTESGSAEFKLNSTAIATPSIKSTFRWLGAPLRRLLEFARPCSIFTELVVFFSFLRVAQDFVRFIYLFKFFFSGLFVLGDVGMMFAGQLAKSAANLVFAGRFRHAECFVII